jgi:hypothetical protein
VALAQRQHGVVHPGPALALGFTEEAIRHRIRDARLHPSGAAPYAVGRPELTRRGIWPAATLTCDAVLIHASAAALWEIRPDHSAPIAVTLPAHRRSRRPGIAVHRMALPAEDTARRHGIPVTSPVRTLIDLAASLTREQLEATAHPLSRQPTACATRSTPRPS